jgi:hypothetical protein
LFVNPDIADSSVSLIAAYASQRPFESRGMAVVAHASIMSSHTSLRYRGEDTMSGKILVVGGYGSVGRTISVALGDRFPQCC